jgi:hypothetical protein
MAQYLQNVADIYETPKCSNAIYSDPLYRISPKLDTKCGKYRCKFIYAPMHYVLFIAQIFIRLTVTQ